MKKFNLFLIALFSLPVLYAQDLSDALRYSQSEIQGTARFRALSGAFGALGGDMSAVSINPAGSAIFVQSHASFSLSNADVTNDTRYFNGTGSTSNSNFDIHQGGAAFVFTSKDNSPWRKFSIGIAYDRTNNFDNEWFAKGTNTKDDVYVDQNDLFLAPANSISSYFALYSQGIRLGDISLLDGEYIEDAYNDIGNVFGFAHQQAFLGYQSYILNADDDTDDNNTSYYSVLNSGNFQHDYIYTSSGYNGKVAFNFAAQYGDNLYLGLNLNSHFIDYQKSTSLEETNNHSSIDFIRFDNTLSTRGSGFSFQLGGILKLSQEFRVGLTYDSPTWYTIEEETTQLIDSNLADQDIVYISDIVNVYPEYKLQTPAKVTGSLAYVFGQQGLITFDYSTKDYSKTKFKPNADYTDLNADVNDAFTSAATYRLGGEYIYKQFSFRGGYRFEESPYKDGTTVGDLNGFSLGLGYNFGNTKLDLTFDQANRSYKTPLYNIGLTDRVAIDRTNSNISLSLSFNI